MASIKIGESLSEGGGGRQPIGRGKNLGKASVKEGEGAFGHGGRRNAICGRSEYEKYH